MTRIDSVIRIISVVLILMLALPCPAAFAAEGTAMTTKFIHETPDSFIPGFRIIMNASISDASGIKEARCYFRTRGTEDFIFVDMQMNMDAYEAVVPAPELGSKSLSYFFLSLNGNRQVARTQVFEMQEKDTAEAKDLKDAEVAKAKGDKVDLNNLKDRLMDRLEKEYKDSLEKSQIAKKEGTVRAGTDMAKAPEKAAGFSDRVEIMAAQPDSRYSLMLAGTGGTATAVAAKSTTAAATGAAATGGGTTLAMVIGGLAVIAGGAALAGGGGGGGGGSAPVHVVTAQDFTGTWVGTGTAAFESGTQSATVTLNSSLTGTMLADNLANPEPPCSHNIGGTLSNGTLSFIFPLCSADVGDPDCINWNVNGAATLSQNLISMSLTLSGTFCSGTGGQTGSVSYTLNKQ